MANASRNNGNGHKNDGYFHPAQVWVGGNIGNPLISVLDQMTPKDLAVVEFSSFQLEIMTRSPKVAAVLNITPNHLDRHANMEEYTAAKRRILEFQEHSGVVVLNREDPGSWGLRTRRKGSRLFSFGLARPEAGLKGSYLEGSTLYLQDGNIHLPLMPRSEIQLRGEHNLMNVLAACAISWAAELPPDSARAGVSGFTGVPHRLEFVRSWGGANWYNDSIATAPERAIAAIRSFQEPLVLLAGGRDKNLPWDGLVELIHERVDHVVIFGAAAPIITAALGPVQAGRRPFTIDIRPGFLEALSAAESVVEPGDVVLLSPGATSYDEFKDFEERGEVFRKWLTERS
jgi:UDP-N-acetylmuramoylalanine--D-glutamate ligase